MSVAFDASGGGSGTSCTLVAGATSNCVVLVSASDTAPGTVTATWNGNAMTRIVTNQTDSVATWLNVFYILNSSTGSHTVAVSAGGTQNAVTAFSFTGVGSIGTPTTGSVGAGGAGSYTLSATITGTGMVMGCWSVNDQASSVSLGQSNVVKNSNSVYITAGGNTNTGSGSVAVSGADSNQPNWSLAVLPINAVSTVNSGFLAFM